MRSSFVTFMFCITISLIAFAYSSNLTIFSRAITKTKEIIKRTESNSDFIGAIPDIINKYHKSGYKSIHRELEKLESETITIEIRDISSKLNPNFMDFTLFNHPLLRDKLTELTTWQHLHDLREEIGLTGNIREYDHFFKENDELFTLFNLPNINNASDVMVEYFYNEFMENPSKAFSFRKKIVYNRITGHFYDEVSYSHLFYAFDFEGDIRNYFTIIPTWNVNFVPEILLKVLLNKKYNGRRIVNREEKLRQILELREKKEITMPKLKNILKLEDSQKSILTYLGDKTTFWEIDVTDKSHKLKTTFIMGWYNKEYRLISVTSELI